MTRGAIGPAAMAFGLCALVTGCGGSGGGPSAPTPPPAPPPTLTAPALESPADGAQLDTLRPTLTVRNGTSTQPGSRTYEFQISDSSDFANAVASEIPSFFNAVTTTSVAEDHDGTTSFTPAVDLQPTTRFYWRARLLQSGAMSPWSATGRFKSRLVGFIRAGELYDPLIHGETVGVRVGSVQFIPGRGARLVTYTSHIRYRLPQTIRNGEFSMEVEGLRANAPGDKMKILGMQEGQGDFITNRYRVSAEYRSSNIIAWRAIFGGNDEILDTDRAQRESGLRVLKPDVAYLWKATWGGGFRLVILEGGVGGKSIYNIGEATDAAYAPSPHYAYLGAPVGRSGADSASYPGAIYRNVWLGNGPRPASLGSALQNDRE